MPLRITLAIVCLIPMAFLAAQLRSVRLEEGAIELVERGQPGAAAVADAEDKLKRAGDFNPTSEPEFRRAQLYLLTRRPEESVELLRDITADEPDHLQAWIVLARAADQAGDAELAEKARDRAEELNPQAGRLAP